MKVETLKELRTAFEGWRRKKRHLREPVPSDLRERAHRAIEVYGVGVVARATKLEQSRLKAEHGRRAGGLRASRCRRSISARCSTTCTGDSRLLVACESRASICARDTQKPRSARWSMTSVMTHLAFGRTRGEPSGPD
jgi:hypothetical protein